MKTKKKRTQRRHFTQEYKAEVVQLVRRGNRTIGQIARDLDLPDNSIRMWVRQADIDDGKGPTGALTTGEREELTLLKRENKTLRLEREILKNCLGGPSRRLLDEKLRERRSAPARSRFERRRLMATSRRSPASSHGGSLASREQWPSTFWCSANP